MLDLATIRRTLAAHEARGGELPPFASVALILRERSEVEILVIERARRAGDPWSGHMAFPGGRIDRGESPRRAAERETAEEVGLRIGPSQLLGRLDDQEGRRAGRRSGLSIAGFVYHVENPGPRTHNEEVRDSFWVPLSRFHDPSRRRELDYPPDPGRTYSGVEVGASDRVVWGLTYRFLEIFFRIVGKPL